MKAKNIALLILSMCMISAIVGMIMSFNYEGEDVVVNCYDKYGNEIDGVTCIHNTAGEYPGFKYHFPITMVFMFSSLFIALYGDLR